MAVTGLSQSLVSRSLALLEREGLLDSRRQGKHVFYRLKKDLPRPGPRGHGWHSPASGENGCVLPRTARTWSLFCRRFQRGSACDMAMVKEFIDFKNQKQ